MIKGETVLARTIEGATNPVLKIAPGEAHVFTNGRPNQFIKLIWDESGQALALRKKMNPEGSRRGGRE